jgi:hypothetical protein
MSGSQSRFRGPLRSHRGFQVIGLLKCVEYVEPYGRVGSIVVATSLLSPWHDIPEVVVEWLAFQLRFVWVPG